MNHTCQQLPLIWPTSHGMGQQTWSGPKPVPVLRARKKELQILKRSCATRWSARRDSLPTTTHPPTKFQAVGHLHLIKLWGRPMNAGSTGELPGRPPR